LNQDILDKCIMRMDKCISSNAIFEKNIICDKLMGSIDCLDGNNVWEFKCVRELNEEHMLQLALYKYILEIENQNKVRESHKYYLFNIVDNNTIRLESSLEEL